MINYLDIQKQLQLNGWFLKKSEIETLYKENDNLDVKKIIQLCLNIDLRDIQELDVKGKLDSLNSDVVLQIQKIRNVGAPKDNPESKTAPRLFKLQLTDGNSTYSAIEAETIQAFTMNTAPGTKILLKLKSSSIETANGQLLLKPSNCTVLGGNVTNLVEKWELTRSLAKYAKGARIGGVNGPPPFIAFGEKIQQNVPVANDKSFKSLQNNNGKENENENSEFNVQRNDAIAEAYKSGTKKTFGGGTNKLIDSNVQKIMEKGYTEEQANQALKFSRNNLEKALNNLKRHEDKTRSQNAQKAYDSDSSRTAGKDVVGKRSGKAASSEPATTKPSAKVSLFEFLEDKLPQHEYENATAKNSTFGSYNNGGNSTGNTNKYSSNKPSYSNQERFENNISSSFRKNDKETNYVSKGSSSAPSASKSQQLPSSSSTASTAGTNSQGTPSNSGYIKSATSQNVSNSNNRNSNMSGNAHNSNYSRDNRESREGSSKYYNQYNSGYQSSNSAPYRQKSNNYASSNQQSQQDQRKQPQQQSHYSQNKYSQGNQGGANYQRGKPNPSYQKNESKYDSKYDSKYESKYESKYDSRYDSKYDKKYDQKYDSGKYDYNSGKPNYNSSSQNYGGGMYNNRGNYSNQSGSSKYYDSNNKNEQQSSNSHVNKGRTQQVTDSMGKLNLNKPVTPQAQPATNVQGPSSHKTTYNAGMSNGNKNSINKNRESQPQTQVNATVDVNAKNSTFGGNDFAKMNYNPYQIIGFQNKETNEYAKNVLKNQQQQQPPQQQSSGPAPATTIYHIPAGSVQTTNAPPPPFVQNHQVAVMPPMTTVIPTQGPTVYHSNYPIMMQAPPLTAGPLPTQPNAALINGKAGDFCLAKYWEDGQFYNAKITGVSDNTYVVLFTDYGNHEEVRKSDCLPLITTPISSAPSPHPPTFPYQPSFHPIQLHPQAAGPIQTGKSGQIHPNSNKMIYQQMGPHSSQRNNGSNGNVNGNKIHRYNVSKN